MNWKQTGVVATFLVIIVLIVMELVDFGVHDRVILVLGNTIISLLLLWTSILQTSKAIISGSKSVPIDLGLISITAINIIACFVLWFVFANDAVYKTLVVYSAVQALILVGIIPLLVSFSFKNNHNTNKEIL